MTPETNGFSEWMKHSPQLLLAELKRLNENIEGLRDDNIKIREVLARHDVFVEKAVDDNVISEVSRNTEFRTNVNKLVWKLVGTAIVSAGGITGLVNYLSGAFVK